MNKGFEIHDKDGKAININDLDREVCEIVGNEYDNKHYCLLGRREDHDSDFHFFSRTYNWFDTIGWMIASEGKTFEQIIEYYTEPMKEFLGQVAEDGTIVTIDYIYPYHMKLLRTWIAKGYQPKSVDVY